MTAPLRVIVVDDEPLAREGLRLRLGWIPDVEVVGDYGSTARALDPIAALTPDVLFLDIQMPERDGFALLASLERDLLPAVVFVTAFADHAVRAFRVGALDYLVKPFDDEMLRASVERARTYVESVRARTAVHGSRTAVARLMVRDGDRVVSIATEEINWLEADGDHVRIHAAGATHRLRATMQAMEARLDPTRFVRVHRGAIVAVPAVRELLPYSRGEHLVRLADGATVPLSRRHRARLMAALNPEGR